MLLVLLVLLLLLLLLLPLLLHVRRSAGARGECSCATRGQACALKGAQQGAGFALQHCANQGAVCALKGAPPVGCVWGDSRGRRGDGGR